MYQPFAWCIWGFQNCTSRDSRVRKPLFEGEMIVLGGCILSMLAFFVAANRRAQRLSENAEDLHGSARLASPEDIEATGIMRSQGGVYVGGWYNDSTRRLQYLRHNGPEHVLAFAPTRSGKGVGLVIPTLLAWEESAVIYDIKGENWAKTAGFRASRGQLCFKFSPVEDGTSSRFNPLAEVRLFTPRDVSDAQNIADMIIRSGEDSPMERHWEDSAASLTTGMILHACYTAAAEDRVACLADLSGLFTRPGVEFRETLNEMISYQHDADYRVLSVGVRKGLNLGVSGSGPVLGRVGCFSQLAGAELLLESLVHLGGRECFRIERTSPLQHVFVLFVFGVGQHRQIFFIPVSSAHVFWRRAAFAADARRIWRGRLRQQDGLQ